MIDRIDYIFDTNLGFSLRVIAPGVAIDSEKPEYRRPFYLYNPNLGIEHCFTNDTGSWTGNLEHSGDVDAVDKTGHIFNPSDDSLLRVVSDGLAVDLMECERDADLSFYFYDSKRGVRHAWENGLGTWRSSLNTWFIESDLLCDDVGFEIPTREGDPKGFLEVVTPGIAVYISSKNSMPYYVYNPYLGLEFCYLNNLGCWFASVEVPTKPQVHQTPQKTGAALNKTVTTASGGRQSELYQYDVFIMWVAARFRQVMEKSSAKYDLDEKGNHDPYTANWKLLSEQEHVQHAIAHLNRRYQQLTLGSIETIDEVDNLNAAIRCMMSLYMRETQQEIDW